MMTREQIIEMAKEAGLTEWHESIQDYGFRFANPERLEAFAALVAAATQEECAKVCDERMGTWIDCAEAIRVMGETK